MKHRKILTIAALLLGSVGAFGQTVTKPVGVEKITLQPDQFNLLGVRLHGAVVHVGTFDASTAISLTDTGASFSSLVAATEYIVELANGSNFNIVGSDASGDTITLPTVAPADEQAYTIRIANTLNSVLGNPTNLAGTEIGTEPGADIVWIPSGAGFERYFYITASGAAGWYKIDDLNAGAVGDSIVINPGEAIYVQTLGSTVGTTDVMVSGTVKTTPTAFTISQEWNLISSEYPAGSTLDNSGLSAYVAGTENGTESGTDIIWIPSGVGFERYFHITASGAAGWYKIDDLNAGPIGDTTVLPSGFYIQDANTSGGGAVTPPTSYDNL